METVSVPIWPSGDMSASPQGAMPPWDGTGNEPSPIEVIGMRRRELNLDVVQLTRSQPRHPQQWLTRRQLLLTGAMLAEK